MNKRELIKLIYLYLFSAVGLVLIIISSVKIVDLGLKNFVFKKADNYYFPQSAPIYPAPENQKISQEEIDKQIIEQQKAEEINRQAHKQKDLSNAIAMLFVGLPLFFYHWHLILKNRTD